MINKCFQTYLQETKTMASGGGGKAEWHDWVGDLFEPAFCATIDDLVAHEQDPDNKPRVKHLSVHDPEAIRKVIINVLLKYAM